MTRNDLKQLKIGTPLILDDTTPVIFRGMGIFWFYIEIRPHHIIRVHRGTRLKKYEEHLPN